MQPDLAHDQPGGAYRAAAIPRSEIASTEAGPIEYFTDGDGPVVLGFHGTPGGYDQIALVASNVVAAGFRIVGWSRPGYLRTPIDVGKTPLEQADAAARLLDTLGIARVCVSGASGGGPSAYSFAARHPDRVWALIAECAISKRFRDDLSAIQRAMLRMAMNDFTTGMIDWFAARYPGAIARQMVRVEGTLDRNGARALAAQIAADPAKQHFVRGLIASFSPLTLRKRGLLNDLEQFARIDGLGLEQIRCPALIIHGVNDDAVNFSHGEFAARAIPGAKFIRVEGAPHLLWISQDAAELARRRIEFLRQHAPR
ncbi:MAG: alpha/beta fold hydrolase [Candidatus Binataceae bacterium]